LAKGISAGACAALLGLRPRRVGLCATGSEPEALQEVTFYRRLEGGRIAVSLLPHRLAWRFAQLERFGFAILLALLFLGGLDLILTPLMRIFLFFIKNLFAL
jgi:hypothetical protein